MPGILIKQVLCFGWCWDSALPSENQSLAYFEKLLILDILNILNLIRIIPKNRHNWSTWERFWHEAEIVNIDRHEAIIYRIFYQLSMEITLVFIAKDLLKNIMTTFFGHFI